MRHAPILIAILFFIPCAHAGERIEFYSKHINVVSSNESVEVGDELGDRFICDVRGVIELP